MSTEITNSQRQDRRAGLVTEANRQDLRFAIVGFVVLVIAMITLLALVFDFMIDGVPRISWRLPDQTIRHAGPSRPAFCPPGSAPAW